MLTVSFTILGDVAMMRAFSRYGDAVKDYRKVWDQIKADFHRIETEQFDSLGGRSGVPWQQLSPDYEAWKMRNYPGQPLMRLTGQMWGQFAMGIGMNVMSEPLRLRIGPPSMRYPVYHQQGSFKTNLPMRKVVALTEPDKTGWVKMIHNYIYDKAKEAHLA